VFPVVHAEALAALALAALERSQPADALAHAERGCGGAISAVAWPSTMSILQLARAEALRAVGRSAEALAAIREARDRIRNVAATLDDAGQRESYLTNVDANARTLQLAREWDGSP
jgi:hypothetical protein